jgi:hypothetical protein
VIEPLQVHACRAASWGDGDGNGDEADSVMTRGVSTVAEVSVGWEHVDHLRVHGWHGV